MLSLLCREMGEGGSSPAGSRKEGRELCQAGLPSWHGVPGSTGHVLFGSKVRRIQEPGSLLNLCLLCFASEIGTRAGLFPHTGKFKNPKCGGLRPYVWVLIFMVC